MATAFAMVLSIGSCKKKEEPFTPHNNAVVFTSNINAPQTKGGDVSWAANDAIGVFMVENGTIGEIVRSTVNKRYNTAAGDGNFLAGLDHIAYYPLDGSKVDFVTYYPYRASINSLGDFNVDVADQSTPKAISLLYARETNNGAGYDRYHGSPVEFQFRHQLSRLRLTINTPDPSVGLSEEDLANLTAAVSGLPTTAAFNLADGTFGDGGNIGPIYMRQTTEGLVYEAIVIPGEITADDDVQVAFTAGSTTFAWELPAVTLEGGMVYPYAITLVRQGNGGDNGDNGNGGDNGDNGNGGDNGDNGGGGDIIATGVAGQIVGWHEVELGYTGDPGDPTDPEDPEDPEEPVVPEDPEDPKEPEDPEDPEDPDTHPVTKVFSEIIHAATGTTTIPTQILATLAGDHVFVYAHNKASAYPEAPAGYIQLAQAHEAVGDGQRSARIYHRVAAGPATALGEWANTNALSVVVLRGVQSVGNAVMHNGANLAGPWITFPEVDLDGPSYVLTFASARQGWPGIRAWNPQFEMLVASPEHSGNATEQSGFWIGITKEAYAAFPQFTTDFTIEDDYNSTYRIRFQAASQRFMRGTVAIKAGNP